jgi:hypothetical protein
LGRLYFSSSSSSGLRFNVTCEGSFFPKLVSKDDLLLKYEVSYILFFNPSYFDTENFNRFMILSRLKVLSTDPCLECEAVVYPMVESWPVLESIVIELPMLFIVFFRLLPRVKFCILYLMVSVRVCSDLLGLGTFPYQRCLLELTTFEIRED